VLDRFRHLVPPGLEVPLLRTLARLRQATALAGVWRWTRRPLPTPEGEPYRTVFVGPGPLWGRAASVVGCDEARDAWSGPTAPQGVAVVSAFPIPGSAKVPWQLQATVPLGRPVEEVLDDHNKKVARRLRALWRRARLEPVADDATVARLNREMIEPFAAARHGESATHVPLDRVRSVARGPGRLDLLYFDGEPVGCELGTVRVRGRQRAWVSLRFGCPPAVFEDPERLWEANSLASHLVMIRALEEGFDAYDMGASPARPDSGLLQWKRKRGGVLDALLPDGFFWVRPPHPGTARFLWNTPLFAVERGGLVLHLGLPEGPGDDEVAMRYRDTGFRGLAEVRVHAAREPGEPLLARLRDLHARHAHPPPVRSVPAD
jgi:hypothetical protein